MSEGFNLFFITIVGELVLETDEFVSAIIWIVATLHYGNKFYK